MMGRGQEKQRPHDGVGTCGWQRVPRETFDLDVKLTKKSEGVTLYIKYGFPPCVRLVELLYNLLNLGDTRPHPRPRPGVNHCFP